MTPKNTPHIPVMLEQLVQYFAPATGKRYIDATLGAGGHTLALLQAGATVMGIDHDQSIIDIATARIKEAGLSNNFTAHQGSFADLLQPTGLPAVEPGLPAVEPGLPAEVGPLGSDYDGVLFDLGVSSLQLDTPSRGFSFRHDAPLDMRMDPDNQAVTAADLIGGLGRGELVKLFRELSEEKHATLIADAICDARKVTPIKTTFDLVKIIESKVKRTGRLHPATRVFQSLRMAVNTERDELKAVLPSALSKLSVGGKLITISFHSGEHKIIKSQLKNWEENGLAKNIEGSPFTPTQEEIISNPRSRSAIMHVVKRLK